MHPFGQLSNQRRQLGEALRAVRSAAGLTGEQLAQRLGREYGMTFVEHSQDSSPMALAASRLMEAIRTGQLVHDGDRALRAHVLNAAQRTVSGERWKFDRPRRGGRVPIDVLTALAMVNSAPKRKPGVVHIY